MELTGKCKEAFKSFVEQIYCYEDFIKLPDPMKWGVLVDFFDSVGVDIEISKTPCVSVYYFMIDDSDDINCFNTRQEARAAAIEQANKLFNEQN